MATGLIIRGVDWDARAFSRNERYAAKITRLYKQFAKEAARIAGGVNRIDPDKPFTFKDYPQTRARIDKLLKELSGKTQAIIQDGTLSAWAMANAKNDALIDYMASQTGIHKSVLRDKYQYGGRNEAGLKDFQNRKVNGLGLSQRVWKHTQASKADIETAIDIALTEGKPATALSRDIRNALIEPNKIFRRVKGADGKLRISKAAAAYHPGQGIYRSSYKNAMRVARTETNMAYREADFQRWSQMDFVKGIEIKLSNNPHHCDVCASLVGEYPKDFRFLGWHPQCRCYATPVLLNLDEYNEFEKATLSGEKYKTVGAITRTPAGFNRWVKKNQDRINRAKTKPYFIRDNGKYIKPGVASNNNNPVGIADYAKKLKVNPNTSIFDYLKKPVLFSTKSTRGAYFDPAKNEVVIPIDARRKASKWKAESVIYHEFGHAIDEHHGIYKMPEVKTLMEKYRKKFAANNYQLYKEAAGKIEQLGMYSYEKGWADVMEKAGAADDTLMSLNSLFGRGHSLAYWARPGNKEKEFIAHAFENIYVGNEVFKKYMPELYKEMQDTIKAILAKLK